MAVDVQAQKVRTGMRGTDGDPQPGEKIKDTAVASEDYEMAARYRDQIRALREGWTKTDA